MLMPEMPGWISNLLSAVGGIGAGGYVIHRRLKSDKNSDAIDSKGQQLYDSLAAQLGSERISHREQLSYERETNMKLGETIDRLAKERNEAVQNVGRLEGQVTALQGQVTRLQSEVEKLESTNKSLFEQIMAMRDEVSDMSARLAHATIRGAGA